jgi:hypothetical protein
MPSGHDRPSHVKSAVAPVFGKDGRATFKPEMRLWAGVSKES